MKTLYQNHYITHCNLVGRPNVLIPQSLQQAQTDGKLQTQAQIFGALSELVNGRPTWRFTALGNSSTKTNDGNVVIYGFKITEDGEDLGSIRIEYKGRDYKIKVSNDRIDAKRERGSGYYTDDPIKAAIAIRKHFFRLVKDERMTKALEQADAVVSSEHTDKQYKKRNAKHAVFLDEHKFAVAHMQQYLGEYPARQADYTKYQEAKAEALTVETIKTALDKGQATIIVLDGTTYIARKGEEVKTYTSDTLTEDMRRKIGILKLVNDKQMVSDIGCRVLEHTFVLLPESEAKEQE